MSNVAIINNNGTNTSIGLRPNSIGIEIYQIDTETGKWVAATADTVKLLLFKLCPRAKNNQPEDNATEYNPSGTTEVICKGCGFCMINILARQWSDNHSTG